MITAINYLNKMCSKVLLGDWKKFLQKQKDGLDKIDLKLHPLVPKNPNKHNNMHKVVNIIIDNSRFIEVLSGFFSNILVKFACRVR